MNALLDPWPWYVGGPLIGLMVPLLLLIGNKSFGISSSLRHVCASCVPAGIPFLQYGWRKQMWNLLFVGGIAVGGALAANVLMGDDRLVLSPATLGDLGELGFSDFRGLVPAELFAPANLAHPGGLALLLAGGFVIGFGTRYAGGCTSGHAITGLSNLQWPSLVAVIGFFTGGLVMTHLLFPLLFG